MIAHSSPAASRRCAWGILVLGHPMILDQAASPSNGLAQQGAGAERAVGRSARRTETKPISHQGSRSAASLSPMEKCLPGVIASAQGFRMRIAFAVLAY